MLAQQRETQAQEESAAKRQQANNETAGAGW
jgi:hypothetical protein